VLAEVPCRLSFLVGGRFVLVCVGQNFWAKK
jgi:hypothetical protein